MDNCKHYVHTAADEGMFENKQSKFTEEFGIIESHISYVQCSCGRSIAFFLASIAPNEESVAVAAYNSVSKYAHKHLKEGSRIVISADWDARYSNGEMPQITANYIYTVDSNRNVTGPVNEN